MAVKFTENLQEAMDNLHKKGAFLTVKDGEKVNTMTISWGNVGFEWNKPIFTALVRKSRYTHELIESSREFTVSIPSDGNLQETLAFCGTKSGRDVDKFEKCELKLEASKNVDTPVIAKCGFIYECRVVYKQDMDLSLLSEEIKRAAYPDEDYHTIYYGEIVACYNNK
jgi:flavin reductase (DIM6/NTAB) family NADH-FMN oxidoreductase RutF